MALSSTATRATWYGEPETLAAPPDVHSLESATWAPNQRATEHVVVPLVSHASGSLPTVNEMVIAVSLSAAYVPLITAGTLTAVMSPLRMVKTRPAGCGT